MLIIQMLTHTHFSVHLMCCYTLYVQRSTVSLTRLLLGWEWELIIIQSVLFNLWLSGLLP